MAVTEITKQFTNRVAGLNPAMSSGDADGFTFINDQEGILVVHNSGESPVTMTVDITKTLDGRAVADYTVAIPAGQTRYFGPFPKAVYNNTAGHMGVTFSDPTGVTVAFIGFGSISY